MSAYVISIKSVPAFWAAACRVQVPENQDVPKYLKQAYSEVAKHVALVGAHADGPCLTVWHTPATQYVNEIVDAVRILDGPAPSSGRVEVRLQPEVRVAAVTHRGKFEHFTNAHAAIIAWAKEGGHPLTGEYREIYHRHEPHESVVEVQFVMAG